MTAPSPVVEITAERVAWFAEYYKRNPEWGIFHVSLSDGNYRLRASDHIFDQPPYSEAELREVAAWFAKLSPSQRRRLKLKAEDRAQSIIYVAPAPVMR